jgi:hypothetical protein
MALLCLCAAALAGEARLRADDIENKLADWVDKIQKGVEEDADLTAVKIVDAKFVDRLFVAGRELRLNCEDATEEQLRGIETLFGDIMKDDAEASAWLKTNVVTAWARVKGRQPAPVNEQSLVKLLIQNIHDQIEAQLPYAGVIVTKIDFERSNAGPGIRMQLVGRLGKKEQMKTLEVLVNKLLAEIPEWKNYRKQIDAVSTLKMKIEQADSVKAKRLYNDGRGQYKNKNFKQAEEDFGLALVEDPANESYLAWRIVTTLALGDEERTKLKLVRLLKRNRGAVTDKGKIIKEFEEVQGPLRQRLIMLNDEVLRSLDTGAAK